MAKRLELLKLGAGYLQQAGVQNSLCESEICLSYFLNCPRIELYLDNLTVEEGKARKFWQLLQNRAKGEPLQYLLGYTNFMGLEFKVKPGVFIPRPETEILVETTLNILTRQPAKRLTGKLMILDIGTGCGNIAVSLAKYLNKVNIFACDITDSALQLTKENAYLHQAAVYLVKSNIFSAFAKANSFDLIVSNPPYLSSKELACLPRELRYEPRIGLDGGADSLYFQRQIINQAPAYLQNGGSLCLEIGDGQADAIKEILKQSASFPLDGVFRDYNDKERVVVVRKRYG